MSDDQDYYDYDEEDDVKSKSQIKRELHALRDLGKELTDVPMKKLQEFGLSEDIIEAIKTYHKIKSNLAKKRQLQYLAKVIRSEDPEPIQASLDKYNSRHEVDTAFHHKIENWRDRLIAEGDPAIEILVTEAPDIDRQQLRQLIRNAKREMLNNKPPKSARSLFKLLREALSE